VSKTSEKYYAILKDYFEPLHTRFSKNGYSEPRLGDCIANLYSPEVMKATLVTLNEELKQLDWKAQANLLESVKGLKTAYLGHAYLYVNYPETTYDFLRKIALYSDTIIINDPILSELLSWEKRGTGEVPSFSLIAQYAVRLLEMEDLFNSSEIDPPICFLAPCSVLSLGNQVYGPTDKFIEECVVPTYAGEIFDRKFNSSEELFTYLGQMQDFDEFMLAIRKSSAPFTNPIGTPVTFNDFLRVRQYYEDKYEMSIDFPNALFLFLRGRFSMAAYDLAVNGRFADNFATDFQGVWQSFIWLLNSDNKQIAEQARKTPISKDTLVLNALQKHELSWIGNVPFNKIVEMRRRGELQDMRELLGRSITEIQTANDDEFVEVGRQVEYNLEQAFRRHSKEVQELSEEYKRKYKIDAASIAATGTIGLISAMYPPIASIAFLQRIVGAVSIKELIEDFFEKRKKLRALQRKPVGMLFEAKKVTS
jgi:hypothetical protein